ncbi:MAG: insulinase family protein [Candidatus Aminicenantes bacterium]|nr:insulinase family protein [Candidatus Aminicenantes bacterium]
MHQRKYIKLKTAAALIINCLLIISLGQAQEEARTKNFELENGLQVFLYERHNLPLINIAIAVNLGTKDESEESSGLVHILEHYILFRGTALRSGTQVSQDIRRHGAYFNAHTGLDLAVFEISLPSEHAEFALKNQKEILFNLKIDQKELDQEKKVLLEEISQIEDDPVRYATSLVFQKMFPNHPYQKPVYGKQEVIEAATGEQLEEFHRRFFVPQNCALAAVGDFRIEEIEEKIREIFGGLEKRTTASQDFEEARLLEKTVEIEHEMDVNQAYLAIGIPGPDFNHLSQYTIDVLTEILAGGVNPLLPARLRGRRDLIHDAWMRYAPFKYGGVILIFVTLDPKNVSTVTREAVNFLKETRALNYSKMDFLGESQLFVLDHLECAQNQIKFKFHLSQERGLSVATSLAMYMHLNEISDRGNYLDYIEAITSSELRKVAGEYLSRGRYVILTIRPKRKE